MPRLVIVTGAAGFIGSHLVRALIEDGDEVVGIDNFDPFYDRAIKQANADACAADGYRLVEADITDAERMVSIFEDAQPDVVFHIAALAGVRPSLIEPQRFVNINVDGLVNVLEASRAAGCQRLVFASSSSVYGDRSAVPFTETDEVSAPISPYAATKRAGELLCSTWCHLYEMSIAALRLFTVYGPSQRPDLAISKFMQLIADDRPVPMFGDGTSSRDYTFVEDIVRGMTSADRHLAACDPGFFRIYNLGGSQTVTLSDLIASIGDVVGQPARIERLPMQPGDVTRTFADVTRAGSELGYAPSVGLVEGLERQWAAMSGG